jgi:hypothetical protein
MQTKIAEKTWWQYIGLGDGRGTKHMVTSVSPDEVTTFTNPNEMFASPGYSWLGSPDEFLKCFRPVA